MISNLGTFLRPSLRSALDVRLRTPRLRYSLVLELHSSLLIIGKTL